MATKLFLRSTQRNGIGSTYFDMSTEAGAGSTTAVVNTVVSGTEIQWTQTAGGALIQWVSGRAPVGGFTLTTTDISIWAAESNMTANCGGRFRVFKRTGAGVESELGGGPFNDGIEFGTAAAEMLWAGDVIDTAFAENDRILLKVYITNVGTMGGGFTCTLTYNAADAATGDSFFNIAETVTFKGEETVSGPHAPIAVGVVVESETATFVASAAPIAVGLVVAATTLIFRVTAAAVALGVVVATRAVTFVRTAAIVAAAVVTGAAEFIAGAGGNGYSSMCGWIVSVASRHRRT